MLRCLVALCAMLLVCLHPRPALAWDLKWCLEHHVRTGECAHWFPPPHPTPAPTPPGGVLNSNTDSSSSNAAANSSSNSSSNAAVNSTNSNSNSQNQSQIQGQQQTANGGSATGGAATSSSSSGLANSGNSSSASYGGTQALTNAGNSSVSNSTNWQAPLNFIGPAGPCDRAAAGLTAGSTGVGVGVTVPIGRRGGECNREESVIDRCMRYDQAGYTVDGLDCSRLHRRTSEIPSPVPMVVTRTRLVVYKEPAGCAPDPTRDADLALIHLHRREPEYRYPAALAAHDRLVKACVSASDMLRATDGR